MLRAAAILTAVAFLSPALRADDEAKAVVAKAIKAHGGEEALTKYKASQSKNKGKINIPGIGEVDFTQQTASMGSNRLRESFSFSVMGQEITIETRVLGDKISIEANGNPVPNSDAIKEILKDAGHMMKVARLVSLVKEPGFELSSAGESKVQDKPVIGIRVSMKDKKDITLYFDKTTHLMAKIEYRTVEPMSGNEMTEERIVLEYQKTPEGLMSPKKVMVKRDGKDYLSAEVEEVKYLEKLDDAEFQK